MQLVIGQYTQLGPIHFKCLNPLTHGLGYMFMLTCMIETICATWNLNDNVLYFLLSMQKQLQWMICRPSFKDHCLGAEEIKNCTKCLKPNSELSAYLYWRYCRCFILPQKRRILFVSRYIFMGDVNLDSTNFNFTFPPVARIILSLLIWGTMFAVMVHLGRYFKKVIQY